MLARRRLCIERFRGVHCNAVRQNIYAFNDKPLYTRSRTPHCGVNSTGRNHETWLVVQ